MNGLGVISRWFTRPVVLSRKRVAFALVVAGLTDAIQVALGPFGWVMVDEGLDVLAMLVISATLGFHTLLLPTFIIEFIPGPDMLPTWTGCTAAVIMLRMRDGKKTPPVVDVPSEVTRMPESETGQDGPSSAAESKVPPKIR